MPASSTLMTNPVSVAYANKTGSGVNSQIRPFFNCWYPGGPISMGYNDGSSLSAWVNYVNDTYSEVNALVQISPLQIAVFPASKPVTGCTVNGNRISVLTQDSIALFRTSAPNAPVTTKAVNCSLFLWAGTFLGAEHYFHQATPCCNCVDKVTKPCPPTVKVVSSDPVISGELANYRTEFINGRNYLETYNSPYLTSWPDVTLPVHFVDNWDDATGAASNEFYLGLCDAVKTNKTNPNLLKGKIVVIHHVFATGCPGYLSSALIELHGAAGFVKGLFPATVITTFVVSPIDYPYWAMLHEDYMEMRRLYRAPLPVPVPSPPITTSNGQTPTSGAVASIPHAVAAFAAVVVAVMLF